jgi:hypothetical protein
LSADEIQFSASDIAPALVLLESVGKIVRREVKPNTSRPGWLAKDADVWAAMELTPEVAEQHRIAALAAAIVASFHIHKPGLVEFGMAGLYEVQALQADLRADGIDFDEGDLAEALQQLEEGAVSELDPRIVWRTVYRKVSQLATRVMVLTRVRLY